jgi:hypothetical protein
MDWLNGTYYPTTTDGNTGGGGIDLAAFNGFQIAVIPEPTTWTGLAVLGAAFTCYNLLATRRRRRA